MTNTSGGYNKKYMKLEFNSDDNLPLNTILKLRNLIIVEEDKRYYPKVF